MRSFISGSLPAAPAVLRQRDDPLTQVFGDTTPHPLEEEEAADAIKALDSEPPGED